MSEATEKAPVAEQGNTDSGTGLKTAPETKPPETSESKPVAEGDTLLTQPTGDETPPTPVEGAPESYGDFTVPEGFELGEDKVATVTDLAKKLNLSQENAQEVVNAYAGLIAKETEAYNAKVEAWKQQTQGDPEIGGPALTENLAFSAKAIERFGGDDLKKILSDSGLGNHPVLVKVFSKIGRSIGEDKVVASETGAEQKEGGVLKALPQGEFK